MKKTLDRFKLPFFHMKDFATFRGPYKDWSESKRRDLYGRLLAHMGGNSTFPIGSILVMDDYRSSSAVDFGDPYYINFACITAYLSVFMDITQPQEEKLALVFSDHVEFRTNAKRLWDKVVAEPSLEVAKRRTNSSVFREMHTLVPLQAAAIIAYELYKEYERRIDRPNDEPRHGYKVISEWSIKHGKRSLFAFHTEESLANGATLSEFGIQSPKASAKIPEDSTINPLAFKYFLNCDNLNARTLCTEAVQVMGLYYEYPASDLAVASSQAKRQKALRSQNKGRCCLTQQRP